MNKNNHKKKKNYKHKNEEQDMIGNVYNSFDKKLQNIKYFFIFF